MNTPTPTPRTDAAWASSFEPCEYRAAHTARIMRECSQQLEAELAAEREKVTMLLSDAYALTKNWHDRAESAEREVERLRAGIGECLRTNGHLADGEDCTLIGLKRCLRDPAARESNGGDA